MCPGKSAADNRIEAMQLISKVAALFEKVDEKPKKKQKPFIICAN